MNQTNKASSELQVMLPTASTLPMPLSPSSCASSHVASPTPTMASSLCSYLSSSPISSFATPILPTSFHSNKSPTSSKFEFNSHPSTMLHATLLDKFNTSVPPPCYSGSMLPFMINEQEEDEDDEENEDELYKNFTTPSLGAKNDLIAVTETNPSESYMNRSCPNYSLNSTTSNILATSLVDFNKKKPAHYIDSNHMAEVFQNSSTDINSIFPVAASTSTASLHSTINNVKCYWNNCLKQFSMLSQLVGLID